MRKYRLITVLLLAALLAGCATQAPYFKLDQSLTKEIRTFDGGEYISLVKLCGAYGINLNWDDITRKAVIEKKGNSITLMASGDKILLNGAVRKLDRPVIMAGGAVYVPVSFARNNLGYLVDSYTPESVPEEAVKSFAIKTIVLDPGHGGKDAGAVGRRLRIREKDLNLRVAMRVKSILEENGIRVIMTRDDNTFIPLPERARIANKSGADLFVSLHINASRSKNMNGFECYYLSEALDDNSRALEARENASLKLGDGADAINDSKNVSTTLWDMTLTENRAESVELARSICGAVENSGGIENRGIKSARFYVLKYSRIPAVLVEMGYISNRVEEAKLKDPQFLERLTNAVASGILRYKNEFEKTEGFTKT